MVGVEPEDIKTEETKKVEKVTTVHSLGLAVGGTFLLLLMILSGYFLPMPFNWVMVLFFMLVFFVLIGWAKGKWNGIFIDERNQMSLSRFQLVLWTLIVLSAFFAIALSRIHVLYPGGNLFDALNIAIPWQLWALIGISVTSIVGTPLILSQKKEYTPKNENKIKESLKGTRMTIVGTVCKNKSINDAKFTDIFSGDEIADCSTINMAKVQMFFFTIIIVLAYSILLFNLMMARPPAEITSFPALPDALVALLGISHAGYLTQKAVPSTLT